MKSENVNPELCESGDNQKIDMNKDLIKKLPILVEKIKISLNYKSYIDS